MDRPFSNAFYNQGAQMTQQGAAQAGANNIGANKQAALTGGLNGGWQGAVGSQTGRANQAMTSQGNVNSVLQALQRQMSAAGTGLSFNPQMTGQSGTSSSTSSMGGLGSWLPQMLASLGGSSAMSSLKNAQPQMNSTVGQGSPNAITNPGLMNPMGASSYGGGSIYTPTMQEAGIGSSGLAGMLSGGNSSMMNPYFASMMPH